MKHKTFAITTFIFMIAFVGGFVFLTYYVDPFFHYHAPTDGLEYPLWTERYQNDGIARHFEYDTIVTGTSMTENFDTDKFDELFGTKSVKLPLSGASYREINDQLVRAYTYNDNITTVFRCLDLSDMASDKDSLNYDEYPDYLYDNDIFNDVSYVLNKEIFYDYTTYVFQFMSEGGKTTPMKTYKVWSYTKTAKELVENYEKKTCESITTGLSEEEVDLLYGNLYQNVIATVEAHPETHFIFYFPPYSILWWYDQVGSGNYAKAVETQKRAIDLLLEYDNVELYSFFDDYVFVGTLGYYVDSVHYNYEYSNQILDKIAAGTGRITKENEETYLESLTFYNIFDYDSFLNQILAN